MSIIEEILTILEEMNFTTHIENNQVIGSFGKENRHLINIHTIDPNRIVIVGIYNLNQEEIDKINNLSQPQQKVIVKETLEYLFKFQSRFRVEFNENRFCIVIVDEINNISKQIKKIIPNISTGLELCEIKLDELLWVTKKPEGTNDIIISRHVNFFIPNIESPFEFEIEGYSISIDIKNYPFIPDERFISFGRTNRPPGSKIRFLNSSSFPFEKGSLVKIIIRNFGEAYDESLDNALKITSKALNRVIQTFSYITDTFKNEDIINQISLESFSKNFHLRTNIESSGYLKAIGKEYEVFENSDYDLVQQILNNGGLEFPIQLVWQSKVMYFLRNYELSYVELATAIDIFIQNILVNHPNNNGQRCRLDPDTDEFQLWSPDKNRFKRCGFMKMINEGINYVSGFDINRIQNIFDNMDILYGTRCNIIHSGIFDYQETKYHAIETGRDPNSQLNHGDVDLILKYDEIYSTCLNLVKNLH